MTMITVSGNSEGNFYAIDAETQVDAIVLTAASTAKPYVIPTGAKFIALSSTGPFYAKFSDDATANPAAIPAADVTAGSSPVLNPNIRKVSPAVTEISFISPQAGAIVTITPML